MHELLYLYKLIDQSIAAEARTIFVIWHGHDGQGVSAYTRAKAYEYVFRRAKGRRIMFDVKVKKSPKKKPPR